MAGAVSLSTKSGSLLKGKYRKKQNKNNMMDDLIKLELLKKGSLH
jgi:hypothetical protein